MDKAGYFIERGVVCCEGKSRIRRGRVLRRRRGASTFTAAFFLTTGTAATDAAGVEVAVHEEVFLRRAGELDDGVVHAFEQHVHGAEAWAQVGGLGLAGGTGAGGCAQHEFVGGSFTAQGKKAIHGLMGGRWEACGQCQPDFQAVAKWRGERRS